MVEHQYLSGCITSPPIPAFQFWSAVLLKRVLIRERVKAEEPQLSLLCATRGRDCVVTRLRGVLDFAGIDVNVSRHLIFGEEGCTGKFRRAPKLDRQFSRSE